MGDAADSLNLILETDPVKVKKLLEKINNHNLKRQALCNKIYDEAIIALEKMDMKKLRVITFGFKKMGSRKCLALVLFQRGWTNFIGRYFCSRKKADILKGSGRSIDDINIHSVLSSLSDILVTYGGHSMAAGVTIQTLGLCRVYKANQRCHV